MDFLKKIGKELVGDVTGKGSSGSAETYYVTAVRAEGIKDKDRFSKSDPYLVIDFAGKSVRTRTINNDLSPNWNETFTFNTSSNKAKDIKLKLKDSDIGLDDTIGTAVVSAAEFPMYSGEEKNIQIPVTRHEEIHGVVHLKIKKVGGPSNPNYQNSYQQQPQHNSNYPPQQQQQNFQSYPQQYQQQPPPYQQQPYHQQQQPYQQIQQPQQPYSQYPQQSNMPYGQQPMYGGQPSSQYSSNQPYNQPYNQQYNQGYHR